MSRYEIRVEGILDERWSSWFGGLAIRDEGSGVTVITGLVEDEAALHGVLSRISELGLVLVSVQRLAASGATPPPPRATKSKEWPGT
jgi:hypothetical protein